MRNLTLSTLLSCAIALTACGNDDDAMIQQFSELLTRPALEEVVEQHVVDRAGQHTADFRDKWGGLFGMDSVVHTVLSVDTGCHLTEAAYRRGTPRPSPEQSR